MGELKPCPFCGSGAGVFQGNADLKKFFAQCMVCGCRTLNCFERETAIKTWNKRKGEKQVKNLKREGRA